MKVILLACGIFWMVTGCQSIDPSMAEYGALGFTYDKIESPLSSLPPIARSNALSAPSSFFPANEKTPEIRQAPAPLKAEKPQPPATPRDVGVVKFYQAGPLPPKTNRPMNVIIIPDPNKPTERTYIPRSSPPPPYGHPEQYTTYPGTYSQNYSIFSYPQSAEPEKVAQPLTEPTITNVPPRSSSAVIVTPMPAPVQPTQSPSNPYASPGGSMPKQIQPPALSNQPPQHIVQPVLPGAIPIPRSREAR